MTQHTSSPGGPTAAALTLTEKASLTSGAGDFVTEAVGPVPMVAMSDGPHGLRLPKEAGDGGQLDLHSASPATCFPPAVALGSSWDVALAEKVAGAIAAEARDNGVHVVLGPGINIKRSPLCGRNFEYFSEDPLLTAELGGAMVRGLQRAGVGAALKHFAVNNQETDRMRVSADIDERPLREIYLRAFERIVRRDRPWSVMSAYNALNGTPLSENRRLLTDILRREWGFDGIVMSDWGAVRDRVTALAAGLDLQMPTTRGRTDAEVVQAVKNGDLAVEDLDASVERLALFAQRTTAPAASAPVDYDAHHALARQAAERCIVLLRNEQNLLPLDAAACSIAVIGELARTPRYQGAGSSQVTPTQLDAPLDALRELAGPAAVDFTPGHRLDGTPDEGLLVQAVRLAASSDTVILFLGLPAQDESEGFDRDHLDLPTAQLALVERIAEANPRTVVVLSNGGVVRTAPWHERVPALVEGWLLGQGGGTALARVLFGHAAPSGRLAETVPLRLEDSPSHLSFPGEEGHVRYGEGVFVGYRGHDRRGNDVVFPFGHGLTYTTFAYDALAVDLAGQRIEVRLSVTNTGLRSGRETVQIYVSAPDGSRVARPPRELRGFAQVDLEPGQSREVSITFERGDLAYYSEREAGWFVEAGTYTVEAGASSRDIRCSADLMVEGDASTARLTGRSTLGEWLAHPTGGPLLLKAFARGRTQDGAQDGTQAAGALADPVLRRFLAGMPLEIIAEFPQSSVPLSALHDLCERANRMPDN